MMKKTFGRFLFSLYFAVFLISTAFASPQQDVIQVSHTSAYMSQGLQPAYQVSIPDASLSVIQQNWIKKLRENVNTRVVPINEELVMEDVVKYELSNDPLTIFTLFGENREGVTMLVFVQMGDYFFSAGDAETDPSIIQMDRSIREYIGSFALAEYKIVATNKLITAERSLKSADYELSRLIRERDNLLMSGSSIRRSIDNYEWKVMETNRQLFAKQKEIVDHRVYMRKLVNENERRAAVEKLRRLERQKSTLEKNRSIYMQNLSNARYKLDNNILKLNENQSNQAAARAEIAAQQNAINYYHSVMSIK